MKPGIIARVIAGLTYECLRLHFVAVMGYDTSPDQIGKCLMRLLLNLLNRNEAGDHCKSNSWIDLRVPAPALCCRNGLRHEPRSDRKMSNAASVESPKPK